MERELPEKTFDDDVRRKEFTVSEMFEGRFTVSTNIALQIVLQEQRRTTRLVRGNRSNAYEEILFGWIQSGIGIPVDRQGIQFTQLENRSELFERGS